MQLNIVVVNYETDESTWKAVLVAESREDAVGYIKSKVGTEKGFKVTSIEQRDPIHAITSKLLDQIKGPEVKPEVVQETLLVCPWCEATDFKSNHALKMHIVKQHADSKKKDKDK